MSLNKDNPNIFIRIGDVQHIKIFYKNGCIVLQDENDKNDDEDDFL